MILSNGMELEITRDARDNVVLTYIDEFGPSTFGGGCDTIRIPKKDVENVITWMKAYAAR